MVLIYDRVTPAAKSLFLADSIVVCEIVRIMRKFIIPNLFKDVADLSYQHSLL